MWYSSIVRQKKGWLWITCDCQTSFAARPQQSGSSVSWLIDLNGNLRQTGNASCAFQPLSVVARENSFFVLMFQDQQVTRNYTVQSHFQLLVNRCMCYCIRYECRLNPLSVICDRPTLGRNCSSLRELSRDVQLFTFHSKPMSQYLNYFDYNVIKAS